MTRPPKPDHRPETVSLWQHLRLFRRDILSAQPEKLYRAWMAEFRTPFFRSFLVNDPEVIKTVLKDRPDDFPKSERVGVGLRPLLGNSVFLTNGEEWKRQRRIIDPAFEGGRLKSAFPAILSAGEAAVDRLRPLANGATVDVEPITSHLAADVIFRSLFSIPIEDELATRTFEAFRAHQRSQPIVNLSAFLSGPNWMPKLFRKETTETAEEIRGLIAKLVERRADRIAKGSAPDDLATKIMTMKDPETGEGFSSDEIVDQVAIFFLAGHETSAAALSWALYLLALDPEWQERLRDEASEFSGEFAGLSKLAVTRDVFRETLRLYPPVPMMVREAAQPEIFRKRPVPKSSQIIVSPWHLHRQNRLWGDPDEFRPDRWSSPNGKECSQKAYLPFSAGPRVCTGAGFAMMEGVLLLSKLVGAFAFEVDNSRPPVPVAQLTVRSKDGIFLKIRPA
ncbi:Cytochrome P450 [Cognatiyoonia sediminum]|uniref:Cytochrome P450 n=1 Tax=Cognatiyoonia sediminum TaxID=1508389 RepID=A0A1M5LXQ8_9RHOB|nr:cytochrome P450 [Cognatiyoonia sediminum]SHG69183.1 Cytochrome P450 [Cognatiyoonia sediminum]